MGAQTIDKNDLKDCLDVIGYNSPASGLVVAGVSTGEDFVNLLHYSCVFLCSNSSGNPGTVVGPVGQDTIIRRIPITSGFGNLIYDAHSTAADYIDCSLTQLSEMHVRLTDERGRTLPLQGHGISLSSCFMEKSFVKKIH